jgi:gamma-glutamyl-gamma-aminobutyrate hydrolase PuuD
LSRPTIGITSYWSEISVGTWSGVATVTFHGYIEGTRLAGGRPLVVPADPLLADDPDDVLDLVDGMVFVGGNDVAPEEYGAERHPMTGPRNRRRDAVELSLMRRALERDIPVLAICRGIQVMNVARGGTLEQHLADRIDQTPHRLSDSEYGIHDIVTVEGSRLRSIVGERATVHAHHHQGIGRVGEGLEVTATAVPDGVIEGLEDPTRRFCVGVLWHPDADAGGSGAGLFRALVSSTS